jgi:hypothetical protein
VTESHQAIRLTDILTNAAALADLDGAATVAPRHLLRAIDHLTGGLVEMDSPPRSPLGRGARRAVVEPKVRELSQRWFVSLGRDPLATLSDDQIEVFRAEVGRLESDGADLRDG